MAFRVGTVTHGDRTVHTLHDDVTGASASILPSYGFNLYDLRLPLAGTPRPVLGTQPGWVEAPRDAARNGTPILFPYPNRVRDGRYRFRGKDYQLPITLKPNAIHGFALDAPWDVVEHKATATEAYVTGRYQISKHSPEMQEHWPSDAILQVRYGLAGRRLTMDVTVTNPTADALPYGFGIHPYFRLPFSPDGDPAQTRVILPASKYWVLSDFLPTGERLAVEPRLDFRQGQAREGLKLDDVLTDLAFQGDECVCRLVDLGLKAELQLRFDRNFRELVVYTPAEGDIISLEPYTQTTDAINLQAKGVVGGLRVLGHGAQDAMRILLEAVG